MEIEFMLFLVAGFILLSFLFHRINFTKNMKKDMNKMVFGVVFIISIVLVLTGLFVGAWNGLFISAMGAYLLIPSLSALLMNLILKKYAKKK